jgi:hypothetical protein
MEASNPAEVREIIDNFLRKAETADILSNSNN